MTTHYGHPVFVYGSLKRGFHNHYLLKGSKFIGEDSTRGKMLSLGAFPGVIKGDGPVHGELFIVDDETLQKLDALEGCPSLYVREQILLDSGQEAFIYYLNDYNFEQVLLVIEDGRWTHRVRVTR